RSRRCLMRAGAPTTSSHSARSSPSSVSRSASFTACAFWPRRGSTPAIPPPPWPQSKEAIMTDTIISHDHADRPVAFTQDNIGWAPWLKPLTEGELTERHWEGLTEASRAKSDYFMLLARDPDILGARTRTDRDIFYNGDGGLPRPERELAAAATSPLRPRALC